MMTPMKGLGVINCYRVPLRAPRSVRRRRARMTIILTVAAAAAWGALLSWPTAEPITVVSSTAWRGR